MFARPPLLNLKEGREGPFFDWLKELGLEDFLRRYPPRTLIDWGWLRPQLRYVLPQIFFTDWLDYPNLGQGCKPEHEIESLIWDSEWFIDNEEGELWFLHPFFRPNDRVHQRLFAVQTTMAPVPDAFKHPRGLDVTPYVDMFYHWQGYALIDVIRVADCIEPIINTPDVLERAEGIRRIAQHVKEINPADWLTAERRWGGGLSEVMTYLSHYRCMVSAIEAHRQEHDTARWKRRRRGARALAEHFRLDHDKLEALVKQHLLVLADDWRFYDERCQGRPWVHRPFSRLRLEVMDAVEWLCYLSERRFEHYLKAWSYRHRQREGWMQLKELLPFEFFADRQRFLDLSPFYLKTFNSVSSSTDKLEGESLAERVDHLRATNEPFSSFLSAFNSMHQQLSSRWDNNEAYDFRDLRPLDGYLLLAIRVEAILRFALEHGGGLPVDQRLESYITTLAVRRGLSEESVAAFKANIRLTKLHDTPANGPIAPIINLQLRLPACETHLVKSFLCALVARNYFAHHYYFDHTLRRSEESAFLLSGILTTVLWLPETPSPSPLSPSSLHRHNPDAANSDNQ